MRRGAITLLAFGAIASIGVALPVDASAACAPRHFAKAAPNKDRNVVVAPGLGTPRIYYAGIFSYEFACSRNTVRFNHIVALDTRTLPYGWKFIFSVATRNEKGRWLNVKQGKAYIFEVTGRQKIQHYQLSQRRKVSKGNGISHVRIRHSGAASPSTGAFPNGSTLTGRYTASSGYPEAHPGPG